MNKQYKTKHITRSSEMNVVVHRPETDDRIFGRYFVRQCVNCFSGTCYKKKKTGSLKFVFHRDMLKYIFF